MARVLCSLLAWALPVGIAVPGSLAAPLSEMVRRDCYFRESLAAIRDWEAILAAWESLTPENERTPLLPIPETGEAVQWPNPIPAMLMPPEDLALRVAVRLEGQKVLVERTSAQGEVAREEVPIGKPILGYAHPGGGGRDHWYHAYHRRFDGLLRFCVQPAPFALHIPAPGELIRGPNELSVALRNVTDRELALTASLRLKTTQGESMCAERRVNLGPQAREELQLPAHLQGEGGGLLVFSVRGEGGSWWLPLFTHVENVAAVLAGVGEILRDNADETAERHWRELRDRAQEWAPQEAGPQASWRRLFEEASALREELLLRRLGFGALLFLKRKPFNSEQPFMDAHHLLNPPGGGIYRLSPVRPEGTVTPVVDSLGEGIYRDLCLHWDGSHFLFAFGNGSDDWDGKQSYHIYEAHVDGSGLRQLTFGTHNDCEPLYLPNGQIAFTSDRSEHFVMCGGPRHVANLFVMEPDGSDLRQLSFNCFNDFNPSILPDGRIVYSRWEYNERSVTSLHKPFTIHPDGTMMAPYYGNATIRPNVVMFPRPVPDSTKLMGLFTAHHGQTHGAIGLIDATRAIDGPEAISTLTPQVPITGEKAEDSQYGWYSDPLPLSEDTYLCSFTPTVVPWLPKTWALYVGDRHGNLALIYRDPDISCAEPVPIVTRPRPHELPPAPKDTDSPSREATLLMINVSRGLTGIAPETAKYLRLVEDVPRKSVRAGGVIVTSATSIYTVKRILGTVPIEADGSAYFLVPANRNLYFEVLDADRREIQRMRSVVCLKPGETRTCVGCHEPRTTAPPNRRPLALRRPPSRPVPPPWGTQTMSFLRDVQPLLNAKCVRCHAFDRFANKVILTDDLTDQFCVAYEELVPYLSVASAMRWDHPDDVYPQPPYTYGSRVSPLAKLLEAGHHGVELSAEDGERLANWIDANGVYYDRYESAYGDARAIFRGGVAQKLTEVFARRCATCHGSGDGRFATWWMTLNRRDPSLSRALRAPLAPEAGGWGRCDQTVFATTADPDYATLLKALTDLRDQLARLPREDLLSLRGTQAEGQVVTLPTPPPPRPQEPEGRQWVYLTSLPWESGRSGWTPNEDGLPRRDLDVEGKPLMLAGRRYGRGIGTHAPSEIIYRLDGRFDRFCATIGGAEAGGTVVMRVYGDDNLLFDSGLLHGMREVKRVDVSVAGVQRLRLVVTDGGDGYIADMANWAEAKVRKATSNE